MTTAVMGPGREEGEEGGEPLVDRGAHSESGGSGSTGSGGAGGPPDGGYGWVVVAAGFVVTLLIDGTVGLFGLLYPAILDRFGAAPTLTAMTGSIQVGVYPTVGVLAALLIHRFGCRRVGLLGGLLSAAGLALSVIAPNITVFIFTFGVTTGLGFGLAYLPALVTVSLYFERRRGVALGVVSAGSGLGILALAPLCQALMDAYGFRGAILMVSGIVLNLCVCAAVMTPPATRSRASSQASLTRSSPGLEEGELSQLIQELESADPSHGPLVPTHISRIHTPTEGWPDDRHLPSSSKWSNYLSDVGSVNYGSNIPLGDSSKDLGSLPSKHAENGLSDKSVRGLEVVSQNEETVNPEAERPQEPTGAKLESVILDDDKQAEQPNNDKRDDTTDQSDQAPERNRVKRVSLALQEEGDERDEGEPAYREESKSPNVETGDPSRSKPLANQTQDTEVTVKTPHDLLTHLSDREDIAVLKYSSKEGISLDTDAPGKRHAARPHAPSVGCGAPPWKSYAALPLFRPDAYQRGSEQAGFFHSMEGISCPRHSATVRQRGHRDHQDLLLPFHEQLQLRCHHRHYRHAPGPSKQTILLGASMLSLGIFKAPSGVGEHVAEAPSPGREGEITPAGSAESLLAVRGGVWLLVRDPAFLALCVASVLIQLGCMVPMFFIADYVSSLQLDRDRAAVLIAIYGVSNMVGRVGAGALATLPRMHVLGLHCLGLALAGLACLLLPLCTSIPLLIAFSVVFGVSIGFFPPLQPLLLVEYFSLEQLTSSLGLLSMVKGIATIVGPPIAGAIYEASKNYGHSFLASGAVLVLSALVHLLMPVARRAQRVKKSPDSPDKPSAAPA